MQKFSENFLKNITAVGFDFDDTLVDEQYYLKSRWERVLSDYSHLHDDLINTFFQFFSRKGHKYNFHLSDTFKKLRLDDELVGEIKNKFLITRTLDKFNFGALELIRFLKVRKIKIGIVTNGKEDYQSLRLGKINLLQTMDFIYYGDNYKKPDPYLFNECLKALKLKQPSQFLYIGNHLEEDILSSTSLAIKACWVTNQKEPKTIEGVLKVNNLKQLLNKFKKELN